MATPSQFFGSLAQVSAAIIAFVIAISTVHYSIERERREERTQSLRESIIDFRDNHRDVVSWLYDTVTNSMPEKYCDEIGLIDRGTKHPFGNVRRAKRIADVSDSPTMLVAAHSIILEYSIMKIRHDVSPSIMGNVVEDINDSFHFFQSNFFKNNEISRQLYKEMTGVEHDDEVPDGIVTERGVLAIDKFTRKPNLVADMELGHLDVDLDGTEIVALNIAASKTRVPLKQIRHDIRRTLVDYEPPILYTVRFSIILLFVGVIIPLMFLLTPPQLGILPALSPLFIFISETILLIVSVLVLIPLLEVPVNQISGEEHDKLSRVSRFMIWLIDR